MKIGIAGCTGRMGRTLIKALAEADGVFLSAGSIRPGQALPGREFWIASGIARDVNMVMSAAALFACSDVVIDFTSPASTGELARQAALCGKPLVSGTTGMEAAEHEELRRCAERAPILWSANTSIGVTLVAALVQEAARKLDVSFDIEIVEMHHRNKVDAPSGTALALGRAAAKGRDAEFGKIARLSREGQTGVRPHGQIGFAALRGGDVIGDHTVIFAGEGERIEITHKSSSRAIYALGAIRAACWLATQKPGLYSMQNVVNG